MSIIQSFIVQGLLPSSGVVATGGNQIDVLMGPSGVQRKRHIFTGPGTFTVISSPPTQTMDYIVVAGGGGGGADSASPATFGYSGAGGGAGGYRRGTIPITPGNYSITIGAGGAGGTPSSPYGANGGDTTFNTITSTGGGGGAGLPPSYLNPGGYVGNPGGSGGGSRRYPAYYIPLGLPLNQATVGAGQPVNVNYGTGGGIIPGPQIPLSWPSFGRPQYDYWSGYNGSGGGGAVNLGPTPAPEWVNDFGTGRSPDNVLSSEGGPGAYVPTNITPNTHGTYGVGGIRRFAGGGAGGLAQVAPGWQGGPSPVPTINSGPQPGSAGGGGGTDPFSTNGLPGTVNTGGGGGGYGGQSSGRNGGAGGPGIVIIAYDW